MFKCKQICIFLYEKRTDLSQFVNCSEQPLPLRKFADNSNVSFSFLLIKVTTRNVTSFANLAVVYGISLLRAKTQLDNGRESCKGQGRRKRVSLIERLKRHRNSSLITQRMM